MSHQLFLSAIGKVVAYIYHIPLGVVIREMQVWVADT